MEKGEKKPIPKTYVVDRWNAARMIKELDWKKEDEIMEARGWFMIIFSKCVDKWYALDEDVKEKWNAVGNRKGVTGFKLFMMRNFQQDLEEMLEQIEENEDAGVRRYEPNRRRKV